MDTKPTNSSLYLEPDCDPEPDPLVLVNMDMTSNQVFEWCQGLGQKSGGKTECYKMEGQGPPAYPKPPSEQVCLTAEQLHLSTPLIGIGSKNQAFDPDLPLRLFASDVTIVHGIAEQCGINLSLFSSEKLVQNHANYRFHYNTHLKQSRSENKGDRKRNWQGTWKMKVNENDSPMKIREYAEYQANVAVMEETQNSDMSTSTETLMQPEIKFGTNIDLDNPKVWKQELAELSKLPPFLQCDAPEVNILNHVGYSLKGINTVQLYMKVGGCRTSGHQENNNFCSINFNIGPGDCEWFATPEIYWHRIQTVCKRAGVNFVHDAWWPPSMKTLEDHQIPVYRFVQRPGEMVWLSPGTVHWVQALGRCNNIAWNVGPFIAQQYKSSMERYEWNKLEEYQSLIPMTYLSWNLARSVEISDSDLFEMIKTCLAKSLAQCFVTLEFVQGRNLKWSPRTRLASDPAHYCVKCNVEVFNILLSLRYEKTASVYCLGCALKKDPSLDSFEYEVEFCQQDLMNVYDKFVLPTLLNENDLSGSDPDSEKENEGC